MGASIFRILRLTNVLSHIGIISIAFWGLSLMANIYESKSITDIFKYGSSLRKIIKHYATLNVKSSLYIIFVNNTVI